MGKALLLPEAARSAGGPAGEQVGGKKGGRTIVPPGGQRGGRPAESVAVFRRGFGGGGNAKEGLPHPVPGGTPSLPFRGRHGHRPGS